MGREIEIATMKGDESDAVYRPPREEELDGFDWEENFNNIGRIIEKLEEAFSKDAENDKLNTIH